MVGMEKRSHSASLGSRLLPAAGAALHGLVVATMFPLFILGFLWVGDCFFVAVSRSGISETERGDRFAFLFCAAASCVVAVALREALIWLRGGQDNDKARFLARVATALVLGILLTGTIWAVRIAQAYRDDGLVWLTILPCAVAGGLASGGLELLRPRDEQDHRRGEAGVGGRIKRYAGRVGLVVGFGSVMMLSFVLLLPAGQVVARGLLADEPFSDGMPVSYWREQLNSKDESTRDRARTALGKLDDKAKRRVELLHPRWHTDTAGRVRNRRVVAALALADVEQRDAALLALAKRPQSDFRDPNFGDHYQAIEELAAARPPRVNALVELLRSDDSYTRHLAVWSLGQLGPEAKAAVPALLELWWDSSRTYGGDFDVTADTIEAIEPGALRRSRAEHYLSRSAIAGAVLAVPVFGVLWWWSHLRRSDWLARQRRELSRAQPNPFEAADGPGAPDPNQDGAATPSRHDTAGGADDKPALGGRE